MRYLRLNKKAQALMEMAVFGTVLLFAFTLLLRYGMSIVYRQNMEMRGFRKAFVRASSREATVYRGAINPGWEFVNADPPPPGNHWRQTSYLVLEDKPALSAAGILPIPQRSPVGVSVEALRSMDMFAEEEGYPSPEKTDAQRTAAIADLPRVEFEINGRRHSFSVAAFKEVPAGGELYSKEDIPNWDGHGSYWQWQAVDIDDVKEGDYVDVDGDLHEEFVLEIVEEGAPPVRTALRVIDYQEGELNFSKRLVAEGRIKEGLQPEYSKRFVVSPGLDLTEPFGDSNSYLRHEENWDEHKTTENISAEETISRTMWVKEGYTDKSGTTYDEGVYPIDDVLANEQTKVWKTPH